MRRGVVGLLMLGIAALPVQGGARDYFTEFEKDFGTTPRGPVLIHYFIVKNTSNQNVNIGAPRVSCGCVSASMLKYNLAPGESTAVYTAMDTRRIPQAGVVKAVTVYVPFFGMVNEEVALRVQAIARDDLVMSPDALAFGNVRMGKGGTATVKYTLYHQPNWQITEITSNGAYIKPELKQVEKSANTVTYEVTAALDPKCPVGNWFAEVWMKTNAPGIEKIRIPVTVNVTTPISVTPDVVDLKDLPLGKETEHRVMLQGTQAFKVLQVKGVDDIIGVKAGSEESRPSHTLTITLKPKEPGDLSKTLEILTDHKEMPNVTLPIKAVVPKKN